MTSGRSEQQRSLLPICHWDHFREGPVGTLDQLPEVARGVEVSMEPYFRLTEQLWVFRLVWNPSSMNTVVKALPFRERIRRNSRSE